MASLTSVEKAAIQLDEFRKSRVHKVASDDDIDRYMAAREADTSNVKPAEDFRDMLEAEFTDEVALSGCSLPWVKLHDKFRIRRGELTLWTGFNGHMKSMVTGYIMLELMRQGEKVCIASFEMKPQKTLKRMATQAVGCVPTAAYREKFLDSVTGKLWLYDQQGETTPARVIAVITYCAEQLGITQFIVDSMMKVIADEDDYNGQKRFVGSLQTLARDLGVHIHLVTHARKREDENKRPGKQDNKGTGASVDQTDNFVAVFKLPKKDPLTDTGPTHCLYIDKQRHGEFEGLLALWFDERSCQFKENPHDRVRQFV